MPSLELPSLTGHAAYMGEQLQCKKNGSHMFQVVNCQFSDVVEFSLLPPLAEDFDRNSCRVSHSGILALLRVVMVSLSIRWRQLRQYRRYHN